MNKFLKSRGLYLLALLPFLVAAMVLPGSLMDGATREALPPLEGMGLLPLHALPDVWVSILLCGFSCRDGYLVGEYPSFGDGARATLFGYIYFEPEQFPF